MNIYKVFKTKLIKDFFSFFFGGWEGGGGFSGERGYKNKGGGVGRGGAGKEARVSEFF